MFLKLVTHIRKTLEQEGSLDTPPASALRLLIGCQCPEFVRLPPVTWAAPFSPLMYSDVS